MSANGELRECSNRRKDVEDEEDEEDAVPGGCDGGIQLASTKRSNNPI